MVTPDSTFFIQLVNFLITLFVLNLLLIRPIREIIRKRSEKLFGLLQGAEGFTAKAEEKLKGYQSALDEARKAGAEERNALREQGASEEKKIVETANQEAAVRVAANKEATLKEAVSARDGLKAKVGGLAQQVADKVLA